jgi:NADH:ubiquinone oxidoreductase subunit E
MSQKPEIFVCTNLRLSGGSCSGQGALGVLKALRRQAAVKDKRVTVKESVCMGYCGRGPNVKIMGGNFHHDVSPDAAEALVIEAIKCRTAKDAVET